MEIQEEVITLAKDQQSQVVKGKRTKRQRPQSPIPFTMSTYSTSKEKPEEIYYSNEDNENEIQLSSTTSQDTIGDEDQDMANCLILLAQGQSRPRKLAKRVDDDYAIKFTSRRYLEAATTNSGKAGYFVYECKTCSRTFPSFQALGGHRASHTKPKSVAAAAAGDEKKGVAISSDEEEGHIANLSLQLSNKIMYNNKKSKIHECSVCGAEFASGQALGGHMRRHRAAPVTTPTTTTNTTLSLIPMRMECEVPQKDKNVISLDLDLNLPAQPEEVRFSSKQRQQQHQQQQQQQQQKSSLVFSATTLVDCHY